MIDIDRRGVKLMSSTKLLLSEFSQGIYDLIRSQAEAEGKPIGIIAPILITAITGAVLHAVTEDDKKNAAE